MKNNNVLEKYRFFLNPFFKLTCFYLIIGLITRVVLLSNQQTQFNFSCTDLLQIFFLGAINDFCISIIGFFFLWLCLVFMSRSKYKSPWGYIIFALIGVALAYVCLFNTVFDEYGSAVPKIVKGLLAYKFISFGLRLFIPKIRDTWSKICYGLVIFIYVGAILFIAIGEYFFWDEFGVRYNFIAVDYLIYTNEVIGNIRESYPIVPLFSVLFVLAGAITYFLLRKEKDMFVTYPSFKNKVIASIIYFLLAISAYVTLQFDTRFQDRENVFYNDLQANGIHRFCVAFTNSELCYSDFYVTIPKDEAVHILNNLYGRIAPNNVQQIRDSLPEIRKNIILITVESLSASNLRRYENDDNITPNIDSLINESLVFDEMYATGNRTVRGLEAVTLCLPPCPGGSVIKRADNADLFSTGKVLKDRGYSVQYLYGGDSYFDNMKSFFGGNGYQVIDKNNFTKNEITFSNIWGVCDEDMFRKAIKIFNQDAESGKPFFGHIMTVSNHRPFTYPDGRIDIPPTIKSRKGGIKYTDYAIGMFIKEARKQPWFNNTVFVVVADHCASSAGKTEIPLDKYHIPAFIYAPGFIKPRKINTLVSQIDLMPTLFGLLHFSYDSEFYGKDVFMSDYQSRAFVATYQNLGYWKNDILTILSPVRKVEQFLVKKHENHQFELERVNQFDSVLLKQAVANFEITDNRK